MESYSYGSPKWQCIGCGMTVSASCPICCAPVCDWCADDHPTPPIFRGGGLVDTGKVCQGQAITVSDDGHIQIALRMAAIPPSAWDLTGYVNVNTEA